VSKLHVYVIQPGDTLWKLACRFGTTPEKLQRLNQLANPDRLVFGQAILLPDLTSIPQYYPPAIKKNIQTLAYLHLNDLVTLESALAKISPYITYGALFEFPAKSDGSVGVSENTAKAVALLKKFQVIPFITVTNIDPKTGFDRDLARTILSSVPIRRKLIGNVLNTLVRYDLAGVNFDFESMYPEDRTLYTDFIAELTVSLNSCSYLSSVAAPAKSADLPDSPWSGAFDYAVLGAVTNFMFLMTYDWGVPSGPPMAVAPIDKVRKVIEYAVSLIPRQKIIQGIPLYGYNWPLPDTPKNTATSVDLIAVYDLAYDNNATIIHDPKSQSPWFQYTDASSARHEVWFEDVRSVLAKYELACRYELMGVGFWSSRNEPYGFPQNWLVLPEMFHICKWAGDRHCLRSRSGASFGRSRPSSLHSLF
jgi:spore germination protein